VTALPAPEGAESITEDELAEALRNAGQFVDLSKGLRGLFEHAGEERLATCLFGYVKRHLREPEYKPGEIYLSPDGFRYMRLAGPPSGCWMELHANGSTSHRGDGRPELPLRKLVPIPSEAEIANALWESASSWKTGKDVAVAVRRLLEGGSDD
jgi:hypothetical protein